MAMNLNDELANMRFSFEGLATAARRAAEDRRERAKDNPYAPQPEAKLEEAKYWDRHAQTVREGFVFYGDPPAECSYPQVAVPGYHNIVTEAIKQNRIRYASQSDPAPFTDMSKERPDAAPAKPIPTAGTSAWAPTAGAKQTPSAPPPARERGKGELSPKQIKTLKKLAKKGY